MSKFGFIITKNEQFFWQLPRLLAHQSHLRLSPGIATSCCRSSVALLSSRGSKYLSWTATHLFSSYFTKLRKTSLWNNSISILSSFHSWSFFDFCFCGEDLSNRWTNINEIRFTDPILSVYGKNFQVKFLKNKLSR